LDENLRTLVVDDEEQIRFFLSELLEKMGYSVTTAASGEDALDCLEKNAFDLAIVDLRLGGPVDGQHVLEVIRLHTPATVIIMLTAHGSLESAIQAIQEGVDGYLLKPVRPSQVRAAIAEALYRRQLLAESYQPSQNNRSLQRGPFSLDLGTRAASFEGRSLELSVSEFTLLAHLIKKAPQVVGPKELVNLVRHYEPEYEAEAREIIKWYIHRLRQKVEPDPANPCYILNVRGVGYRFAA
jgi:DNA-binding response OmpR family regulator